MQQPPRSSQDTQFEHEVSGIRTSATRWRWIIGATLLVFSALIWGAWLETTAYERRLYLGASARGQTNLAVAAEHYVVRVLRTTDAVASLLATVHRTSASNETLAHAMDQRVRNNDILTGISVCFSDGTYLTTLRMDTDTHGDSCVGWLKVSPGDGNRAQPARPIRLLETDVVPITVPLAASNGRPGGVMVMIVSVRSLLGLLEDYVVPEDTSLLVIGADGHLRARWNSITDTSDQSAPELAMLPSLLDRPPGTRAVGADGGARIATVRKLSAYPLTVMVTTAEADVLGEARRRAAVYAWGSAAASVLLAAVTLVLLRMHKRSVRLAESLGHARERLAMLNAELELEVHERTRELEDAYRDLESFTYTVAHDVRAPIAAIRGFSGVILPALETSGDEKLVHYMRRIAANATQMSELTETLLALGKLARAPVTLADIDLSAMAHEVIAGLRERGAEPRAVQVDVQPGIRVQADRVLLRQVLENLIGNAWKFTSRKTDARIAVSAEPETEGGRPTGRVVVTVSDNGAGFDVKNAGDLFKPFHRMHAADDFPGTGVGLATVQRILRLHGGRIWIESAEREGTRVHFTLQAAAGEGARG